MSGSVSGGRSAFCCNSPLVPRRGLGSTAAPLAKGARPRDLLKNSRRDGRDGSLLDVVRIAPYPLVARGHGGTSPGREQLVKPHRISDPDNVTGRVVVEPQGDMKIQLLIWTEAIQSAGIQQLGRTPAVRVVTDILHKQARPLGHLLF